MSKPNPLDAFANKTVDAQKEFRVVQFPQMAHYVQRYGLKEGAAKFDAAMEVWRKDFERNMPVPSEQKETTTIVQESEPAEEFDSSALEAQIAATQADLADHIGQDVVHRKTSPVLGELDEQRVEKKTIGKTSPRYGRFTHLIQSNILPVSETLEIPLDTNLIIAGPMTISGELTVHGYFASIDSLIP